MASGVGDSRQGENVLISIIICLFKILDLHEFADNKVNIVLGSSVCQGRVDKLGNNLVALLCTFLTYQYLKIPGLYTVF